MSKNDTPTLADKIMRYCLSRLGRKADKKMFMASKIAQARKFILGDDMSAHMADLAYASLLTCKTAEKARLLLDSMRMMSRLPHPVTWIEYNFAAKARRAVEEYGAGIDLDPAELPDRNGWLLLQHPQLETAFMAIECSSHAWNPERMGRIDGRRVKTEYPNANALAWTWRVDQGSPPWPTPDIDFPGTFYRDVEGKETKVKPTFAGLLTGVLEYQTDTVSVTINPAYDPVIMQEYVKQEGQHTLREMVSDLRYLWALLATINCLPVTVSDVIHQDHGYVAHGRWRRFVDHKIIHLTIPVKRYRRVAREAIAITRRRATMVRAHLRKDWRHPLSPLCDGHELEVIGNALRCKHCGGQRINVKAHPRGDASLGWVTNDYTVEHEPTP
jgi:hypothetical protein